MQVHTTQTLSGEGGGNRKAIIRSVTTARPLSRRLAALHAFVWYFILGNLVVFSVPK